MLYEMHFCTKFFKILYTESFWIRHHVGFSQVGSHLCKHILCNVAYLNREPCISQRSNKQVRK